MSESGEEPERNEEEYFGTKSLWPVMAGIAALIAVAGQLVDTYTNKDLTAGEFAWLVVAVIGSAAAFFTSVLLISRRSDRRAAVAAAQSRQRFQDATEQFLTSVEAGLPSPVRPLEDEIAEVSASLSGAVNRLRELSRKAEIFESDVKDLAARAEAAKATSELHEDDARRIGLFLGAETEVRIRRDMDKLTAEHNRQISDLRRSGNRTAIWTFVGGVVFGTIGNVVVALLVG